MESQIGIVFVKSYGAQEGVEGLRVIVEYQQLLRYLLTHYYIAEENIERNFRSISLTFYLFFFILLFTHNTK
jgi:hypothetical protein